MFSLKKEEYTFPLKYDDNCYFYEDYLLMDNQDYPYNKIFLIFYINKSKYTNGIRIDHKISLSFGFTLKDHIPIPLYDADVAGKVEFTYDRGLIATNRQQGKVLEFMYEYIREKTFAQRLKIHLNTLAKYGKFRMLDSLPTFHNTGNIEIDNIIVGNLKYMNDQGKIIDGDKYGSYKDKILDPYTYGFEKGTKFFGLVADKVLFINAFNRDVMMVLFNNLYKTGKINQFPE